VQTTSSSLDSCYRSKWQCSIALSSGSPVSTIKKARAQGQSISFYSFLGQSPDGFQFPFWACRSIDLHHEGEDREVELTSGDELAQSLSDLTCSLLHFGMSKYNKRQGTEWVEQDGIEDCA
jgi:hypothetical protein